MDLDGLYPQTTPKLPEYFTSIPTTTKDMSLLVLLPDDATGEIGVYAGERLVGSGIVQSGRCGIPVRGDNPFTSDIDGAIDAEALSLSWWMDGREITELNTELIQGKLEYGTNSLTAIRIEEVAVPGEFALYNVYPNPFNSTTKITYQLTKRSHVNLIVYDLFGREVTRLVNRLVDAGRHNVTFNANNDASGVYFVRLKTVEGVRVMKMMCLR